MSQIELFDYNALSPEDCTEVRLASERIKMRMKRTAEDIVEIGKDLTAIKERLPHGQFLPWIHDEFEMNERTAQNFIRVAERFGDKNEIISYFNPTILYQLAAPSTSNEVVEKAIEKAESGEYLTVAEIKRLKAGMAQAEAELKKAISENNDLWRTNQDLLKTVRAEREKAKKSEAETQAAIAQVITEKERAHNQAMQELQAELLRDIEGKNKAIEAEKKRLEAFKKNPDPETKKKIEEAHAALIELEGDRRKAESRLKELRTQEDHARMNAIRFGGLKGAIEKAISDHADGVLAISSPYMTESLLCDAEMLANALHDFAVRIEQSIDASRQGDRHQSSTVDVDVL